MQMDAHTAQRQAEARAKGYDPIVCEECGNFTLVTKGAVTKCDTCGDETVVVERQEYMNIATRHWPDKAKIANELADMADTASRKWPACSRSALFRLIATMGLKIAQAEKPEDCVDAYFKAIQYLSCPEPGWEGVKLKVQ